MDRMGHAEPAQPGAMDQGGNNFIAEARLLSHLFACVGDGEMPETWPSPLLDRHCALMREQLDKYRMRWIDRTRPFLARVVPSDLPKSVVYPFGGGDLVTALATFPNAEEFTMISLEVAGDVRGVGALTAAQLKTGLDSTLERLRCLFAVSHSKTTNLTAGSHSLLPGEIAFALVAFSIFDYEPVSLRYFRLDARGKVSYLQASDLGAAGVPASKAGGSSPFANVEIAFRPRQNPKAPLRVYRHISANLDDSHFAANHPLALHLTSKGRVSVLVKAASYLLWFENFSHIRNYLLDHAEWMISDSTGIPPSKARAAGFEQECYGLFHGPMLAQWSHTQSEFLSLWQASPQRMLPFYFGYPDIDGHGHVMVTRRMGKTATTEPLALATPTAPSRRPPGGEKPATTEPSTFAASTAPSRRPPSGEKPATTEPSALATNQVSGGNHWRLTTEKGPVYVWQPHGYDPATAGTVVYVHGYYTNVDGAWVLHTLAEQFIASKQNATFIVPEAPSSGNEEVVWPVLADLFKEVERQLAFFKAHGPIIVAGHSGAWRTLGAWAAEDEGRKIDGFVLLDAIYGSEDKFLTWLGRHPDSFEPRMTLVSNDTTSRAVSFLQKIPTARRRATLPEAYRDFIAAEKNVPVLEVVSNLSHMEIITSGKVLPVMLRRSPLRQIMAPPQLINKKPEGPAVP
jgi:hypothetical protein